MACGCSGCTVALGSNTVVSVNNAQTTILAANPHRVNAIIENLDSSILQVHMTTGQTYGQGPMLLQQYQSLELAQGAGVYKGIVYGIRASATGNVGVVEEVQT